MSREKAQEEMRKEELMTEGKLTGEKGPGD